MRARRNGILGRTSSAPAPKNQRALWVSSSLETYGGIATFVRNMSATPLWNEWHVRHVATHCDGTKLARIKIFTSGFVGFVVELILRRPEVVHLHTSERGSFVRKGILTWVSAAFRVPVVLHMHGGEFHEYFENAAPSVQRVIRATLVRADVVIALGDVWAKRLRDAAPGARVEVMPNAIRSQAAVDQESAGAVQVVFLGELCDRKGTSVLIDAWSMVLAGNDVVATKLTIAGWGEIDRAREQIRRLGVEDSIRLAGWLSSTEVAQLLAYTHVLVLPSINEGQPMAILEAMARGICVVSTTAGGIPEMVGDGDGVLVSPGSVRELADALELVIGDHVARRRFGEQGRRRAREEFDVGVISRRFDDLYRTLVGDG
ncbi:hypothetical protein TUM20985_47970 [Mycobacterium antarcticum]|nr:hypothetical protein TUM20985_47970 [Mycolicibacterium sp. TUM20985]GLP77452.1 hypothetical protein TUM20983_45620 [Mycolicibacterium sp. TUM20983]GLP82144.1 hypothetical protein TUM20984_35640 [Mycolicibacterium sp. TUM20984]